MSEFATATLARVMEYERESGMTYSPDLRGYVRPDRFDMNSSIALEYESGEVVRIKRSAERREKTRRDLLARRHELTDRADAITSEGRPS